MDNVQFVFKSIGTQWVLDCYGIPSEISSEKLLTLIKDRIEVFDKTYSRFRKDSIVWEISLKKGKYIFPEDSRDLFNLYEKLGLITNESFTPLVGKILSQAGYDENYSLKPGRIDKIPDAKDVFEFSYPELNVKKPFVFDFGGLGKGYLIDILAKLLQDHKINHFCIDGGGDIYYKDSLSDKKISIGLEHPANFKQVIGIAKIHNQSICASSGNRRAWDRFHHIIDPKTNESPNKILASWVISKDAITADGIATCLFLTSVEELKKYFDFEHLILYPDYSYEKSPNFPAEIFIEKKNLVQ